MRNIAAGRVPAPWIVVILCLFWAVAAPWAPSLAASAEETVADRPSEAQGSVTLLEPGVEPRRALRLQVAAGDTQEIVLVQSMSMEQAVGGAAMPAQRFPSTEVRMRLEVTDVGPGGIIRFTGTYGDASVPDDQEVDPGIRDLVQSTLEQLVGIRIEVTMDDRGVLHSFEVDTELVGDPVMEQLLQSMRSAFEHMSQPLPVEAVGVGARWRHQMIVPTQGMDVSTSVAVRLTELTETGYAAELELEMAADDQPIDAPGLPPGASARLVRLAGEGSGTVAHDLRRPIPIGQGRTVADIEIELQVNGRQHTMTQRLESVHVMREGETSAPSR